MIQDGKMIYKSFFWFLYSYFKKGKEIDPLFSSVCAIVGLQVLNLIFLQGLFFFHLTNKRDLLFDKTPILGFIIITLLLAVNYFYFKSANLKKIENDYNTAIRNNRNTYKFIYFAYIISSTIIVILMLYSIKNNIKWF
ncbi:hypothetical protein GCM10022396_12550 [Flavivirga amylovorans]